MNYLNPAPNIAGREAEKDIFPDGSLPFNLKLVSDKRETSPMNDWATGQQIRILRGMGVEIAANTPKREAAAMILGLEAVR